MSNENAVFGGEVSGHYYFKDFYGCDSGVVPAIFLLDALTKGSLSLDQIHDQYLEKYFISGEINNKVTDVKSVIQSLEKTYGTNALNVIKVDGVTCEFEDWRFNVRGSNTEPLIRLNLEAKTAELMEQKKQEVLSLIMS